MVENQNTAILNKLSEKIKESNTALLPKLISNSIQPVIEVGETIEQYFMNSNDSTSSGTITVHAGSLFPNRDTYVTSAYLSFTKDSTCNIATGVISLFATINGRSEEVLSLPVITLTAERDSVSIAFTEPLKIDRDTDITITGTFTAGVCVRAGGVGMIVRNTLEK